MRARICFRGPRHLIVSLDETSCALLGTECIGQPAAEVFIHPEAKPTLAALDRVYQTGVPERMPHTRANGDEGWLLVIPWVLVSGDRGVATEWTLVRVPIAQALLQPLGLLTALLVGPVPL